MMTKSYGNRHVISAVDGQHGGSRTLPLVLALAGLTVWAAAAPAGEQEVNRMDGRQHPDATIFQQVDANHDGKLSRSEYESITKAGANDTAENAGSAAQDATTLASFDEQDEDGDGMVSKDELWGRDWSTETQTTDSKP